MGRCIETDSSSDMGVINMGCECWAINCDDISSIDMVLR